jgi:hypothetical protein
MSSSSSRSSGRPACSRSSAAAAEILFLEARSCGARSEPARRRVAGYLLRTGALAESTLADARKRQEETLEALAPTLLQMDLVSRADLEQVTKLATSDTIFELFLWDEGHFAFRAEPIVPGPCDKPVAAEMVLLDALRMRDEWCRSERADLAVVVVPPSARSFRQARRDRSRIERTRRGPGEAVHHANGRMPPGVIDLSRLGTFQGARGLLALMRGGVLRAEQRGVAAEPEAQRETSRPPLVACAVLAACAILAFRLARRAQALPSFGVIRSGTARRGDKPPARRARGRRWATAPIELTRDLRGEGSWRQFRSSTVTRARPRGFPLEVRP